MSWPHYADLPFEIVVETIDEAGFISHRELVGRNSLRSEADIRLAQTSRSIVNPRTHRAVLDVAPFDDPADGSKVGQFVPAGRSAVEPWQPWKRGN